MGKTVAVSFEENNVKIVHASLRKNHIHIDRTETIANDQLDNYLRKEHSKEFLVTYEFNDAYHGILTIPIVKPKYFEKIVESEIRKTTEAKDLSIIYTPLGEQIVENKKVMEIFYFAVRNEELRDIVERFQKNGKMVKAIYPRVFSVASLSEFHDGAIMGVLGTGKERTAFLTRNRAIYFIRGFQSLDTELSESDIYNITMTINYCFQNIKIYPSSVMLAGTWLESDNISTPPSAPLACLYKGDYIHCSRETFDEFIIPIASFYTSKTSNILSKEFKNVYMLRKFMVTASWLFIILILLCLSYIFYEVSETVGVRNKLRLIQQNNSDVEKIFSEYTAKKAEIKKYMPVVDFVNRPTPSIQKLLIALANVDTKNIKFTSIEASEGNNNSFLVVINGIGFADTYTSIQVTFKDILDALDEIEGLEITSKTIELESKIFKIEMNYKN